MTVWVIRHGRLVEKGSFREAREDKRSIFPTPNVSRLEPYASPIDGKEISTWRQRDKDLRDSNSIDPRDLKVKRNVPRRTSEPTPEQLSFQWTDPAGK
jgi:hypothetical protein